MTIESELRTALKVRAARVPSSTRLTQFDYQPRTRRLKPPVAVGGLASVAGTAGVVLALTGGATSAFAGWKSTPTTAGAQQLAAAQQACADQAPIAGLPLKLSDTRGPFTFQIYASDRVAAICTTGPSFRSVSAMGSSAPVTVADAKIQASFAHTTNRDGQAFAFADGRLGADVSAVTFDLTDGTKVTATVQNGWYVAWWPGAAEAKSVELTTPNGVQTQTFDTNHESPCGANLCTGGRVGTGDGPVSGSSTSTSGGGQVSGSYSVSK